MFGTPSITYPDLPGDVTVLGMRIVTPDLMETGKQERRNDENDQERLCFDCVGGACRTSFRI